jgi:hypothetical protein
VISDATVLSNASGTTLSKSTSGSPRATFSNCKFLAGTQALQIGGIKSVVSNCTFSDQTGTSSALTFSGGANESFATGCSFNTINGDAISLASNDTTVEGCKFKTVSGDGIEVAVAGTTNSILGNRFDSVSGDNIKDLGVATKIGVNSPNEAIIDVVALSTQSLSVVAATAEAIVSYSGITFPYTANGVRRYRISCILVMNHQRMWTGSGASWRIHTARIHMGTAGTIADAPVRTLDGVQWGDLNTAAFRAQPFAFSSFIVTPLANEKITVSIECESVFGSLSGANTFALIPSGTQNLTSYSRGFYVPSNDFSGGAGAIDSGNTQLRIELMDEV